MRHCKTIQCVTRTTVSWKDAPGCSQHSTNLWSSQSSETLTTVSVAVRFCFCEFLFFFFFIRNKNYTGQKDEQLDQTPFMNLKQFLNQFQWLHDWFIWHNSFCIVPSVFQTGFTFFWPYLCRPLPKCKAAKRLAAPETVDLSGHWHTRVYWGDGMLKLEVLCPLTALLFMLQPTSDYHLALNQYCLMFAFMCLACISPDEYSQVLRWLSVACCASADSFHLVGL